jgi:hypothetical protein
MRRTNDRLLSGRCVSHMAEKITDIEYDYIRYETEKAYMFIINDERVWIPKSIAELDRDNNTVTVPYRFAFDKGLI